MTWTCLFAWIEKARTFESKVIRIECMHVAPFQIWSRIKIMHLPKYHTTNTRYYVQQWHCVLLNWEILNSKSDRIRQYSVLVNFWGKQIKIYMQYVFEYTSVPTSLPCCAIFILLSRNDFVVRVWTLYLCIKILHILDVTRTIQIVLKETSAANEWTNKFGEHTQSFRYYREPECVWLRTFDSWHENI